MAELSSASSQISVEQQSDAGRLARERLLWAVKPFGFLGILLWVLTPGFADVPPEQLNSFTMLAFLLGSGYGIVMFWSQIKRYLAFRFTGGRDQRNRLPDEFYVGTVEEVRAEWNLR